MHFCARQRYNKFCYFVFNIYKYTSLFVGKCHFSSQLCSINVIYLLKIRATFAIDGTQATTTFLFSILCCHLYLPPAVFTTLGQIYKTCKTNLRQCYDTQKVYDRFTTKRNLQKKLRESYNISYDKTCNTSLAVVRQHQAHMQSLFGLFISI